MNILEKDIEDLIWEGIEDFKLQELMSLGFPLNPRAKFIRQVKLGSYGIADLISYFIYDRYSIVVTIYELKKEAVNIETLMQAARYARCIQRMFNDKEYHITFKIILIGKSVDEKSNFCYLTDIFQEVDFYTYSLDLFTGLRFSRHAGYYIPDEKIPLPPITISDIKQMLYAKEIYRTELERTKEAI